MGLPHIRLAEDARVLVSQPPGHLLVVPLAGLAPGLLAGPAELALEDLADVLGVVGDAEAALDEPGDAGGGPQFVVPAVVLGPLAQQPLQGGQLALGKAGAAARLGPGV